MRILSALFVAGLLFLPLSGAETKDRIFQIELKGTRAIFFLPAECQDPDAILLHGVHGIKKGGNPMPRARWRALCRENNFAHLKVAIRLKENRRPTKLRNDIDFVINQMADKLAMPKLKKLAFMPTGHSAGGMTMNAIAKWEDRVLSGANDCSWVFGLTDKKGNPRNVHMGKIPLMFAMGAIPDDFKMIPAIAAKWEPVRKEGGPWSLGFEWGKAHHYGNAGTLFSSYFEHVSKVRLDENGKLREVKLEEGWLGSREDYDSNYATIASYADYQGDKAAAVWLPTKAFAYTWRAYQSKESPLMLTAESEDGEKKLGPFKLKKSFQMSVTPGKVMKLGVKGEGVEIQRVRYFAEDQVIAEASASPWEATWQVPAESAAWHLHAEWTTADGKKGVTNPAVFAAEMEHELVKESIDLSDQEIPKAP